MPHNWLVAKCKPGSLGLGLGLPRLHRIHKEARAEEACPGGSHVQAAHLPHTLQHTHRRHDTPPEQGVVGTHGTPKGHKLQAPGKNTGRHRAGNGSQGPQWSVPEAHTHTPQDREGGREGMEAGRTQGEDRVDVRVITWTHKLVCFREGEYRIPRKL